MDLTLDQRGRRSNDHRRRRDRRLHGPKPPRQDHRAVAKGVYDIIVDMEAVEFLDSTGLGVLVGGLKKVRVHDGSLG